MQSEAYWRQLEAEARKIAGRCTNGDSWAKLADLYRENAENERKRAAGQPTREP